MDGAFNLFGGHDSFSYRAFQVANRLGLDGVVSETVHDHRQRDRTSHDNGNRSMVPHNVRGHL